MRHFLRSWPGALVLLCASAAGRAEMITVYTSANFAPLVINGDQGVYPDLVTYLNRKRLGSYTFRLAYMPRKRIELHVKDGSLDGIVIGMTPQWFDDLQQKKYLWSVPFMTDRFVLVARAGAPLEPERDGALAGRSLGLVLGYAYPGVDVWMKRQGLLRHDALSEEINLEKLRLGRIDCVVVAESVARHYIKTHAQDDQMQLVPLRMALAERRFLLPRAQQAVFDKLAPLVLQLKDDPEWQRSVAAYK